MLITIKGRYEKGQVILDENIDVADKTEVLVTFLDSQVSSSKGLRVPGGLKGKVNLPDDFNEPLEDLKEYM
jgi:hypothetical protein